LIRVESRVGAWPWPRPGRALPGRGPRDARLVPWKKESRAFLNDLPPHRGGPACRLEKGCWLIPLPTPPLQGLGWLRPKFDNKKHAMLKTRTRRRYVQLLKFY